MTAGPSIAGHRPRILIVDDEVDNRELLVLILSLGGFAVSSACCGDEALAAMAIAPPELVLLDVMMPGMTGFEVAVRIKADVSTRNIPVMIVTALEDLESRALAMSAGAEDFMTKPIDRATLLARVSDLFRRHYADYRAR